MRQYDIPALPLKNPDGTLNEAALDDWLNTAVWGQKYAGSSEKYIVVGKSDGTSKSITGTPDEIDGVWYKLVNKS